MSWFWLIIAGLLEIAWAVGLKCSDGFAKLWPSVVTVILMLASFWCLAQAVKGLPLFRGAHRYLPTLVKMRGGRVREEPVSHSPRLAGSGKYGFSNRALVGLFDIFGVRWMKKRSLNYHVEEESRDANRRT